MRACALAVEAELLLSVCHNVTRGDATCLGVASST